MKNQKLPPSIELVSSLRGDSRVFQGWQGRDQYVAKVTEQSLWRCKKCDEYFQTLGEAREHRHG
mgnify:FL=1